MKFAPLLALLAIGVCPAAFSAEPPPTDVVLFDHVRVDDAFSKGFPLCVNTSYKIQAGRRVIPGVVELHTHDTDILYVTQGSATFVSGGTAADLKETAPGEFRAKQITGGTVRHVAQGDVLVIPSGIPHQFTEVNGPFLCFVVKVTR